MDFEVILCIALPVLGLFAWFYWFQYKPRSRYMQGQEKVIRRQVRQEVYQDIAEEMSIPPDTLSRLEAWVQHNWRDSDEKWPFVTNLSNARKAELRVSTLAEIVQHFNGGAIAALRAIHFGVQAANDETFHRQWGALVNRFL